MMKQLGSGLYVPEGISGYTVGNGVFNRQRDEFVERAAATQDLWVGGVGRRDRLLRKIAGGANQPYMQFNPPVLQSITAITGTGEAALWPVNPYSSVAANSAYPGQMFMVSMFGVLTTAASTPGTLTVTPRWGTTTGGTSLGASAASPTFTANIAGAPWGFQGLLTVRAVSTTASASTMVFVGNFSPAGTQLVSNVMCGGTVVTTADTTSALGLFLGITMGSASDSMSTLGGYFASIS